MHTPGPWMLVSQEFPQHILSPQDGNGHRHNIAVVVAGDDEGKAKANARLIAAAPALLAALENIASSDSTNWAGYTAHGVAYDLAGRARAAIRDAS